MSAFTLENCAMDLTALIVCLGLPFVGASGIFLAMLKWPPKG